MMIIDNKTDNKKPRYFPHMNSVEWIEFMEAKGFHFSAEQKAAAKAKQDEELKKG
jgi:hypothetical protein